MRVHSETVEHLEVGPRRLLGGRLTRGVVSAALLLLPALASGGHLSGARLAKAALADARVPLAASSPHAAVGARASRHALALAVGGSADGLRLQGREVGLAPHRRLAAHLVFERGRGGLTLSLGTASLRSRVHAASARAARLLHAELAGRLAGSAGGPRRLRVHPRAVARGAEARTLQRQRLVLDRQRAQPRMVQLREGGGEEDGGREREQEEEQEEEET